MLHGDQQANRQVVFLRDCKKKKKKNPPLFSSARPRPRKKKNTGALSKLPARSTVAIAEF